MNEQNTIFCKSHNDRLELYVRQANGDDVYLMTHRFNSTLFGYLRNGKTVRELRSFKPKKNKGQQIIRHSIGEAVQVFDYLAAEMAA